MAQQNVMKFIEMMQENEMVYDIEVDGINIMFINGVAAEGFSLH